MAERKLYAVPIEAYDGDQTSLAIHWLDPELVAEKRDVMWAILVVDDGAAWIDSYGYTSRAEAESLIRRRIPIC